MKYMLTYYVTNDRFDINKRTHHFLSDPHHSWQRLSAGVNAVCYQTRRKENNETWIYQRDFTGSVL